MVPVRAMQKHQDDELVNTKLSKLTRKQSKAEQSFRGKNDIGSHYGKDFFFGSSGWKKRIKSTPYHCIFLGQDLCTHASSNYIHHH